MSDRDSQEAKRYEPIKRTWQPEEQTQKPEENRAQEMADRLKNFDPEAHYNSDPLLTQLEMQIGLLTSAMTKNMLLATGVCPGLTEPLSDEDAPKNVWRRPKAGPAGNAFADARSLHLRDAARLSFATASLIGAYAKLKGSAPQRITARYTSVPGTDKRKKPRTITTLTHSVVASADGPSHTAQQG